MLWSLSLVLLAGFSLSGLFKRFHLPGLLGMMITGILLGPYLLNLIDESILGISSELRKMALVVILLRAGLSLDLDDLKKVGRPAFLLSFLPALLEIGAITLVAPLLFGFTHLESALLAAILAAVSPAVIVPRMIQLLDTGHGQKKRIPHMILAGSSVDDVFVIVLFVSLLGMNQGSGFSLLSLLHIPLSIVLGITFGLGLGAFFYRLFQSLAINNTVKALLLLGTSFLFVGTEEAINTVVPFSALLAVLGMGMALLRLDGYHAARLTESFSKLWIGAELLLFVLVGAAVNIHLIPVAGLAALALILFGLVFRSAGVGLSLLQTNLNRGERLFCVFSYLPKATVQAAIGAVPFSLGLPAGEMILAIAVLSILFTAPVGALLMDRTYAFLLKKE